MAYKSAYHLENLSWFSNWLRGKFNTRLKCSLINNFVIEGIIRETGNPSL